MTARADDDELEQRIAELEKEVRDLRHTLASDIPRTGSGFPRPPTPRELIRISDEAAIPAMIAVLEANIRILQLIQHSLRLTRLGETISDGATNDHQRIGTTLIRQFDDLLADLERVVTATPADTPGREVIEEARALRAELATRIHETNSRVENAKKPTEVTEIPITDPNEEEAGVDIDAELESIKREFSAEEGEGQLEDDSAGEDGNKGSADE